MNKCCLQTFLLLQIFVLTNFAYAESSPQPEEKIAQKDLHPKFITWKGKTLLFPGKNIFFDKN